MSFLRLPVGFADGRHDLYHEPVLGQGVYRFGVVAVVALVAAVSLGCGGAGERTEPASVDGSALTGAELGWLRSYAAWTFALWDDDLGPQPGPRLVAACREKLELGGPPPTERLRPAAERAAGACPLLSHRGSYRRALDVVEASDDLLYPLLLDSRPLPLSSATLDSRADIALSAFASDRTDEAIEVRCWGALDWERVVYEGNAWLDENDDPDEIYGWQVDDDGRIHMQLEQCNAIARLRSSDVLGLDRDDQVDTADSLSTLAHEIQHFLLPDAEEAQVECAGAQSIEQVARRFGASETEAAALARLYRTELRPDLPDEYVDGGCK